MRSMQFSEPDSLLPAFCIALCLHIAVVLLWPYLNHEQVQNHEQLQPPIRFEIELTQPAPAAQTPSAESPTAKTEPILTKPLPPMHEPKPVLSRQPPVLTAKENIPAEQEISLLPVTPVKDASPKVTEEPSKDKLPSAPAAENPPTEALPNNASAQGKHLEEADSEEAWNGYGQMLYDMVSRNKTYPQIAIRRNWEGKVKIIARFDQGKLVSASIMEAGSGHQVLDDAALDMLRKAVNAMPVRGKLANKIFTVVIPIDFKIEG